MGLSMRIPMLLAAAAVLAGCAAPQEPVDAASVEAPDATALPAVPVLDENASIDAPEWRAGFAWEVEVLDDGSSQRAHLVVAKADASSYQLRTTNEQTATYDAMFDVSYLGRIRASDLAGHQQDQPVQFFSFPLTDGKTWTAQWDGEAISLRAGFSPAIQTPLGAQPGFVIQGTTEKGEPYVEYDYVPALRWWSKLLFAEGYGFTVLGVAENWTGEYLEGSAKTLLTLGPAAPVAGTPGGAFTVDPDQTLVAFGWTGHASAHARTLLILDPDHQEQGGGDATFAGTPSAFWEVHILPAKAGQWHVAAPYLHAPGGGGQLVVQQVALVKAQVAAS